METVRSLVSIVGGTRVQERTGGAGKGNAEAFRRALQQEGDPQAAAGQGAPRDGEAAVRTRLQARHPANRREDGATACHVDVIA